MTPKDKRIANAARGVIMSSPASFAFELGKHPQLLTWVAPRWIKYVIARGVLPLVRNIKSGTGPTRLVLEAPVRHGKTVLFGYATPSGCCRLNQRGGMLWELIPICSPWRSRGWCGTPWSSKV